MRSSASLNSASFLVPCMVSDACRRLPVIGSSERGYLMRYTPLFVLDMVPHVRVLLAMLKSTCLPLFGGNHLEPRFLSPNFERGSFYLRILICTYAMIVYGT